MFTQPNQGNFEFCIVCDSKNPGECTYCDMCYNHAKTCELCNGTFCPCISSFKLLMKPWADWTKERDRQVANIYCGSCLDKIIERSGLICIQTREMGITKKRKINLKFNESDIRSNFTYLPV